MKLAKRTSDKIEFIIGCLNQKMLKPSILESLVSGIPDECKGLRAMLWKISLNYLPKNTTKW